LTEKIDGGEVMPAYQSQSKLKKLIRRARSHAAWNLIFAYSIPAIAIIAAAIVILIRWITSLV